MAFMESVQQQAYNSNTPSVDVSTQASDTLVIVLASFITGLFIMVIIIAFILSEKKSKKRNIVEELVETARKADTPQGRRKAFYRKLATTSGWRLFKVLYWMTFIIATVLLWLHRDYYGNASTAVLGWLVLVSSIPIYLTLRRLAAYIWAPQNGKSDKQHKL